jgi:hypothetical protein
MRITIRLTDEEHADALKLAGRESTGCENISEFFRLLLNRERHKNLGLEKPTGKDFATAFRMGRPNWEQARKNKLARSKASDT